jgi:hypothetical protein
VRAESESDEEGGDQEDTSGRGHAESLRVVQADEA